MKWKDRRAAAVAAVALGYLLLLNLLVAVETAGGDAMIDSLPKALWYSLVTLTTVGYGDLYPLSPAGKIIGALFMVLSAGLFALLIGLVVSTLTGRALPSLRLWRGRRKRWYVFTADNDAARALAARFDDGLKVFCGGSAGSGGVNVQKSLEALFALPFADDGERILFAVDADAMANERAAMALKSRNIRIYCRGGGLDEGLPENVTRFSEYDCCARLYWQSRPWKPSGERAALLGDGQHSQALAVQGLLTAPPDCALLLFGAWDEWLGIHRTVMELPEATARPSFGGAKWYECAEALLSADRIVLCSDRPSENREMLLKLRQDYGYAGEIDALCPPGLQSAYYFGGAEALFTPELVMRQAQYRRAMQLHDSYRRRVDYPVPEWSALSDFLKRSNLAAADHLLTKIRLLLPEADVREVTRETCAMAADRYEALGPEARERCRYIEHARWMLFHALNNWHYAEVRNNARREHPLMVPYESLSVPEREKDDSAWEQLRLLAEDVNDEL